MKRVTACIVLIAGIVLPGIASAQLVPTSYNPPFNVRTPRALGMGNTQVGIGGDYNALFYNPAGLSTIEVSAGGDDILPFELQLLSATWETNADTLGFLGDLTKINAVSAGAIAQLSAFLNKHQGKAIYMRGNSTSYYTTKLDRLGLGVAVLGDWTTEHAIQNLFTEGIAPQRADTITSRKTMDIGAVVGLSFDIIEKYAAVGTNLKIFNRWQTTAVQGDIFNGIADVVANGEAANPSDHLPDFDLDSEVIKPFGGCGNSISPVGATDGQFGCTHYSDLSAGADLGAMFMLPIAFVPLLEHVPFFEDSQFQLGVVWQDVGRTRLSHVDLSSSGDPNAPLNTALSSPQEDVPSTVDMGIAYIQSIVIGNLKVGMDIRDMNRDEIDWEDKMSFGTELEFEKFLTLRAGLNETGGAVGATLRAGLFRFEGGFFQEITDLPSSGRDERFFLSAGFGWYN